MQSNLAGQQSVQATKPVSKATRHQESATRPATQREMSMDLIDLANRRIFGNTHFRPQQREIIQAALQVVYLCTGLGPLNADAACGDCMHLCCTDGYNVLLTIPELPPDITGIDIYKHHIAANG